MKFKLRTLVDITETNIRKGPDKIAIGQQSNYDTLIQVIGLRANPEPISVFEYNGKINEYGFGSRITRKSHKFWEFEFEMPDGTTSVETLEQDFNLVPFVSNLTETINSDVEIFRIDDEYRNIIFEQIDK